MTPFSVRSALRNFAPNVAPPLSAGMSGGGRQKTSCVEPSAVCAPLVGRMYAGRLIVWPAAWSTSRSVSCGATGPIHAVCDAGVTAPGGATTMSPARGSSAPPSAKALTWAFAVPTFVPGAAVAVIVVPFGMTMAARAVESSFTEAEATMFVMFPGAYETESFGDVYAAVATAASASATSAATATTAVRVRVVIVGVPSLGGRVIVRGRALRCGPTACCRSGRGRPCRSGRRPWPRCGAASPGAGTGSSSCRGSAPPAGGSRG